MYMRFRTRLRSGWWTVASLQSPQRRPPAPDAPFQFFIIYAIALY